MKSSWFLLAALLACTPALAGPDKIKFPSDYLKRVLYLRPASFDEGGHRGQVSRGSSEQCTAAA